HHNADMGDPRHGEAGTLHSHVPARRDQATNGTEDKTHPRIPAHAFSLGAPKAPIAVRAAPLDQPRVGPSGSKPPRLPRYPVARLATRIFCSPSRITGKARTARLRGSGAGRRGPRERPSRGGGSPARQPRWGAGVGQSPTLD